jgi:hypothetical protein
MQLSEDSKLLLSSCVMVNVNNSMAVFRLDEAVNVVEPNELAENKVHFMAAALLRDVADYIERTYA